MLFKRIRVDQKSRALLIRNGKLCRVLAPGSHLLFFSPFSELKIELHSVRNFAFRSRWSDQLVRERRDLLRKHFHLVETTDSEIAMISVNGNLYQVLLPSRRALFWNDGSELKVEYIDVIDHADSSEMILEAIDLPNGALDRHLSALDDSTSGLLIESSIERETSSSYSRGNT
ncbi:MAG: hypothetical protein WB676_00180 [Bryobacteraceae bacterium]